MHGICRTNMHVHTTCTRSSHSATTGEWHDGHDIRHAMETTYDRRHTMHEEGRHSPKIRFMMYLEPWGGLPDSSNCRGCDTSWLVMTTCGANFSAHSVPARRRHEIARPCSYFQIRATTSLLIRSGAHGEHGRRVRIEGRITYGQVRARAQARKRILGPVEERNLVLVVHDGLEREGERIEDHEVDLPGRASRRSIAGARDV